MLVTVACEEIVEFLAAEIAPGRPAAFQASEATRDRVAELVHREKTCGLSPAEAEELNHFLHLEHLMRLAKVRARLRLTKAPGA